MLDLGQTFLAAGQRDPGALALVDGAVRLTYAEWYRQIAVVGLPDARWGKIVAAFVKRTAPVEADVLDAFRRTSGLASFKRPRRYVFVEAIPKSPVGKLLRRMPVAGEYEAERLSPGEEGTHA